MFEEEPVSSEMEDLWAKKVELPEFSGTDPIGWISKAERFFEKQGIHPYDKLQWAFMGMEGIAMLWFYSWSQEDPDQSWEAFSMALIGRFGAQMEHSSEKVMLKNQETKPDSWRVTEIRDEPMVEMIVDSGVIVEVEKLQAMHVEDIEAEGDGGDISYLSETMAEKEEECHEGERVPPPEPPDTGPLAAVLPPPDPPLLLELPAPSPNPPEPPDLCGLSSWWWAAGLRDILADDPSPTTGAADAAKATGWLRTESPRLCVIGEPMLTKEEDRGADKGISNLGIILNLMGQAQIETISDGAHTEILGVTTMSYMPSIDYIGFLCSASCVLAQCDWARGPIVLNLQVVENIAIKYKVYKKNVGFSVANDFSEDAMEAYDFDKVPVLVSLNPSYNERSTCYGPYGPFEKKILEGSYDTLKLLKVDGREIVLTMLEDENEERSRELIKLLKAVASANQDLILGKTSNALKRLVNLAPAIILWVVKEKDGRPIEERKIGSLFVQSNNTLMGVDASIIGRTINGQGAFHIQATKVGSDAILSQGWNSLDTVIAAEPLARMLQASSNVKGSRKLLERCLNAWKALLPGDQIQNGANLLHLARMAMLDYKQQKKWDVFGAKAELDIATDHLHISIWIANQYLNKVLKQKFRLNKYRAPRDSRKEGQTTLILLLQSLSTLSLVMLAKQIVVAEQELQEIKEGNIILEAQEALLQNISMQVINLEEPAQMFKAPIQKFAEFVESIFVGTVVALSLMTLLCWYIAGVSNGVFIESDIGITVIEWLIPWNTQTVEEATWEEVEFIKQLHPPLHLEGWEMATAIEEPLVFLCLEDKAEIKGAGIDRSWVTMGIRQPIMVYMQAQISRAHLEKG